MSYAYSIRRICTNQYYGFYYETNNDIGNTKIAYFTKKKDAEKFASFLCKYMKDKNQSPQMYEYETSDDNYMQEYCIYKLNDKFMNFMLGIHGIGFHKCQIIDDFVLCMDSGICNVEDSVKLDIMESMIKNT